MEEVSYATRTDVGKKRQHNEDCYGVNETLGLYVIADGMGGHASGEVASKIAVAVIEEKVTQGLTLAAAIEQAHLAILEGVKNGEGKKGMGTTIVAVQLHENEYTLAWVGDSRAYIWDGELQQISQDHSYVQKLLDSGAITQEEAITHPNRNIITQSLGAGAPQITVDHVHGQFSPPQKILLCSDGLTDEVLDGEIAVILEQGGDDQTIVNNLIRSALDHGGKDNVTVLLVSAPDTTIGTETERTESASPMQKTGEPQPHDANEKSFAWFALGIGIIFLIIVFSIILGD